MAKILTVNEMIAALECLESPAAKDLRDSFIRLAETDILAARSECDHGLAEFWDGDVLVAFKPATEGQPMPDVFENYDPSGEWGE